MWLISTLISPQLQLSAQQLQMIRMQLGAAGNGQQIVLQAAAQPGQQE